MNRFISLILCLTLVSSSIAAPEKNISFKEAVEELTYALEVEWDQKDPKFYAEQMGLFQERLMSLQQEGKTNSALLKETLSALPDSAAKKSIEKTFSVIDPDKMQANEMHQLLLKLSKDHKQNGAKWISNADEMLIPGIIAIVVVMVVITLMASKKPKKHHEGFTSGGTNGGTTAGTATGGTTTGGTTTGGATTGGTTGTTTGGTTGGIETTPEPDPFPAPVPTPAPEPIPVPHYPQYVCENQFICYVIPSGLYDGWTGMPINDSYQNSCEYRFVCTWR